MTDDDDFDQPPPRPRGGFKRFLKRLAIVIGVVLVIWVAGRWQIARVGERKLNTAMERIEATEPDWKFEAIEAHRRLHAPAPEQNSALVVDAVAAGVPVEWHKWRQTADWLPGYAREVESNHLLGPARVKELRAHADSTAAMRDLALSLRHLPRGHRAYDLPDNPITMTLPHLDGARKVEALLHHDAMLSGLDGKHDRGIQAAHAALNVSRSIGDEPMMISQLFRMAIRNRAAHITLQTLAWGTPKAGLAELQAAFLEDAYEPLVLNSLRGERAAMHRLFLGLEAGTVEPEGILSLGHPGLIEQRLFRAYRPLIYEDHAEFLRLMTGCVEAAKRPWHEQRDAARAVMPEGPPEGIRYTLTRLLLPACDKMIDAGLKSRAKLLCTAVAIACERFRQEKGRWPKDLEEIPKSILPTVPVSPFDNKPLRYQVLDDGIVVACFCRDEKTEYRGPPEYRGGEAKGFAEGARLWNPELRGLPALPEKEKDDQ